MSESIKNKKQYSQKPPINRLRIIGEILAGALAGLVTALPVGYVIYTADISKNPGGHYGAFKPLFIFLFVAPVVYVPATAIGVYFVGSRGNQMSSFQSTLVWSFLGVLFVYGVGPFALVLLALPGRMGEIILSALVLFTPPICATYGFNLNRRYKEPKPPIH